MKDIIKKLDNLIYEYDEQIKTYNINHRYELSILLNKCKIDMKKIKEMVKENEKKEI